MVRERDEDELFIKAFDQGVHKFLFDQTVQIEQMNKYPKLDFDQKN